MRPVKKKKGTDPTVVELAYLECFAKLLLKGGKAPTPWDVAQKLSEKPENKVSRQAVEQAFGRLADRGIVLRPLPWRMTSVAKEWLPEWIVKRLYP